MNLNKEKPVFLKPFDGNYITSDERVSVEDQPVAIYNAFLSKPINIQRQHLPIFKYREHIIYLVETHRVTVIVGETGSGKSTQIPQYLYEAGWTSDNQMICVTQPRRMAVMTLANRIADEQSWIIGNEVGYAVRFDECYSETNTKIKFVTDGLLIREMMFDPLLSKYSIILIDEAHERSTNLDIVIGLLKKIMKRRKDLHIIIASATINAQLFIDYFDDKSFNKKEATSSKDKVSNTESNVAAITVEGRSFPVEIFYSIDPIPDYVKATFETCLSIHKTEPIGDILAFLTGQEEVQMVVRMLIDESKTMQLDKDRKMRVLPLYSGLPISDQMLVFQKSGQNTRKIVIATNIAEASITIDGISYVVDCGFMKTRVFDAKCNIESLIVTTISQSSAQQRAGRAGRVRSGKAYRLYPENEFIKLRQWDVPEMQRVDMSSTILQLKALGIDNVLRFPFLSAPPASNMIAGLELLYALKALDDACHLTRDLGIEMAELPLSPQFAKLLLSSADFQCSEEAAIICAMTQMQTIFTYGRKNKNSAERQRLRFTVEEGDHLTYLNIFKAYEASGFSSQWCKQHLVENRCMKRARQLRDRLIQIMKRLKKKIVSCGSDSEAVIRCIAASFFCNAAKADSSGGYRTIRDGKQLYIHPTSVLYTLLPADYVIFGDVIQTDKMYMRDVSVVKSETLCELSNGFYDFGTERQLQSKRTRYEE